MVISVMQHTGFTKTFFYLHDKSVQVNVFYALKKRRTLPAPIVVKLTYRVIQEESAIFWEMIVCLILSKKVHMNMGPILNGYRDMVKRRYGPSCEHEQQLRNK